MHRTMIALLKTYYQLTKPGIIYGNLITAVAGFLLASKFHIHVGLLAATLTGIALVLLSFAKKVVAGRVKERIQSLR